MVKIANQAKVVASTSRCTNLLCTKLGRARADMSASALSVALDVMTITTKVKEKEPLWPLLRLPQSSSPQLSAACTSFALKGANVMLWPVA